MKDTKRGNGKMMGDVALATAPYVLGTEIRIVTCLENRKGGWPV